MKRPSTDSEVKIEKKDNQRKAKKNKGSTSSSIDYDLEYQKLADVSSMKSIHGLNAYFECLDPCRDVLDSALDGWTPPCIIMVGAENTGKSSVLERLALMGIFPRMDGICTRLPIHARLRHPSPQSLWCTTRRPSRRRFDE